MAVLAQKLIQSRKRQYIKVMHRLFFVQNNALETFVVVVLAGP